ncbi:competence protein CoiA family protein [Streptomyces sp. MUSC 14]|uniref:competence protein CoiA family protein n=1 Tax=Streptomyces sp. MUSC 14 TaxID=1354889 RepID=UPI001160A541|nr:competence protein CoiA family protein [Streptomyces sp. MUSC 14]
MQTAVIGHTESELPVVLPMTADEVSRFRRAHAADTFWCGRWLGGCGGRLAIKPYQDRVCHFAHIATPGRPPCRRASVGAASADHLYIKQQILAWLATQSITARATIPEDRERLGTEILFDPSTFGCLRVLLDTQAAPPPAPDGTQLLLSPHIAHDLYRLAMDGYVLRIRCDTDSTGRRVLIGTQTHNGTQWFSLDQCSLQPWGLSTPAAEEVRRLRSTVRPLGALTSRPAPSKPTSAPRPVAAVHARDDRAEAFTALQQAVDDDRPATALRHCLTHAEATAQDGASAEENALLRRATDLLLRKDRGVGLNAPPPSPDRQPGRLSPRNPRPVKNPQNPKLTAAEAVFDLLDTLDRRRDHFLPGEQQRLVTQLEDKARQAGPWISRRTRKQITAWKNSTAQTAPAPRTTTATPAPPRPPATTQEPAPKAKRKMKHAHRQSAPTNPPADLNLVADAAKDVLEHTARLGKTITWEQLCAQVKGLQELDEEQQRQALKAASSRSRSHLPLATLITTGNTTPHPHSRHPVQQQGNEPDAEAAWHKAVASVHAAYRPGPPPPGATPSTQPQGNDKPDH